MSTQINVIDALREAEAGLETAISRLTQRVADYPVGSTSEYQALEIVRKALHGAQQGVQTPFMYAIADGYGQPFFEEQGCVSSEAKDLQHEVDSLNENLDGEPPYKVVAVYTHPTQQGLDVTAGAIALCKHAAKIQNIDFDDYWKIHSDEFKEEAQIVLDAAQAKQGELA